MLDKLTALSQKLGAGMGLLIGNLVWLLTDQILPMGLGLLVGVWVASYLGPTQFGLLNYAIGLVSLFASAATMGLDTLVVPILVAIPNAKNRLWGLLLSYNWQGESLLYCWG